MTEFIVSTDLDGTLLDHHTYSWQAASPALTMLTHKNIPIVINTSKTTQEVATLQNDLNINDPFIVENGSAILINKEDKRFNTLNLNENETHFIKVLGCERKTITSFLLELKNKTGFVFSTFSDYSVEDIMALTGLPKANATLAKNRLYSEPLVWKDTGENYQTFCQHIEQSGFKLLKGGRFIHILGQTNKGIAAKWLIDNLNKKSTAKLIALGDSHNDLDMLSEADIAVLCKSPAHDFPAFTHAHLIKTTLDGPAGWNTSIINILTND